jgi:kynurenine formamidase
MMHAARDNRWGPDDQVGAANELNNAVVLEALGLARRGRVLDLSHTISANSPRLPGVMSPFAQCMWSHPDVSRRWYEQQGATNGVGFADERVEMDLHTGTHIDAIGHVCAGERMYNGRRVADVVGNRGLHELGIEHLPPVVSRGVLVDVAGARGGELEPGEVITADDLAGTLAKNGVTLRRGDVVLIRTGWARYYEADNARYVDAAPGIGVEAAHWLCDQGVVAVGSDTMVLEVVPDESPENPYAVHQLMLVDEGVYIIENAMLEEVAAARHHEFLCLCLAPKFLGATASPLRLAAVV